MNKTIKHTIYLAATILLFSGIETYMVSEKKQVILKDSRTAFGEAVKMENTFTIDNFYLQYDANLSTDTIQLTEKIEWFYQYFWMKEDTTRSRLDSLFREKLAEKKLSLPTAIHCLTRDGKEKATSAPISKDYLQVGEMSWRLNYDTNRDILLQAYIQLPLQLLINQWYTYVWLLFAATGYYLLLRRQRKAKPAATTTAVIQPPFTTPEPTVVTPPGIPISEGYYWEEKTHTLRHAGKSIQLRGNNAKLMAIFLKNQPDFLITYQQMIEIYEIKDADSIKVRAYQTIAQLRSALKELEINIVSVRGTGYQLLFACNTETNQGN